MKKAKVPQLRFPEFDDNWQADLLGKLLEVSTGNKDTKDKNPSGKYPFFVRSDNVERINSYSFDGEAILTSGDGVGVGKNFHYINGKFDYHQRVYCLYNFDDEVIGEFIYHFFSKAFYKRVMRLSAKNSVDSVRMDMITKMPIRLPSRKEQQKIASFLSAVDKKIRQLRRKKELLEGYKKGVMQKLFSQEIRFRDKNGEDFPDWEVKKLGELGKFSKGKGISKSDVEEDGNLACIRYGELYTEYGELINEIVSSTNLQPNNLVLSKSNDVLIPSSGETHIDIAIASCVLEDGVALGGDINIFRTKQNGVFLAYYLKNACKYQIASLAQGNSVIHLYSKQLKTLGILVPSMEEQNAIVEFLKKIDTKIQAIEDKIRFTQTFKKGLLQQMFV